MTSGSPFAPPEQEERATPTVGPVRAVLGVLLCGYGLLLMGLVLYVVVVDQDQDKAVWGWSALVTFAGIAALAGGWRWSERRRSGPWLWVSMVAHVASVAYVLAFVMLERRGG